MARNSQSSASTSAPGWTPVQVALLASICLIFGLIAGYYIPAGKAASSPHPPVVANAPNPPHPMPTIEQMKALGDAKAAPLLEKLTTAPNDAALLVELGEIYNSMHQFQEAAQYLDRALKVDPKNIPLRVEFASSLYYSGDVDGALAQLDQALKYDPKDTNSLFNIGVIRWKGKHDAPGAIAAWQELLKLHPDLDRRPIVERMIAEASTGAGAKN
jgi:cytochrome c-type biogenesis protein CcmH/NrfG